MFWLLAKAKEISGQTQQLKDGEHGHHRTSPGDEFSLLWNYILPKKRTTQVNKPPGHGGKRCSRKTESDGTRYGCEGWFREKSVASVELSFPSTITQHGKCSRHLCFGNARNPKRVVFQSATRPGSEVPPEAIQSGKHGDQNKNAGESTLPKFRTQREKKKKRA